MWAGFSLLPSRLISGDDLPQMRRLLFASGLLLISVLDTGRVTAALVGSELLTTSRIHLLKNDNHPTSMTA